MLSLAPLAGATDDPYQWTITDPDGRVTRAEGEHYELVPLVPGEWTVELLVIYQHESRANLGTQYTFHTEQTFVVAGEDLRLIFADGFETGTAASWSATIGENHG